MFFEKGWVPLMRLTHEARQSYFDALESPEMEAAESDDEIDKAFDAFCERVEPDFYAFMWDMVYGASCKQALGCTTSSGRTVLLDPFMADAEHYTSGFGTYFDLYEARIGEGSLGSVGVEPFVGLPVVVRESEARAILGKLAETTLAAEKLRPDEFYIQKIVGAYDDKKPVTKAWVRENITGRIKWAQFDAIWAEAARQRPFLSRSGPRGPRRAPR
jgi:hypothetical protein